MLNPAQLPQSPLSPRSARPARRAAVLVVMLFLALFAKTTPAHAYTDDYPWATATTNTADSFGFTKRQCVSYAAWRLYKAGHRISNSSGHWGSAYHWDDAARALGKRVTTVPKVGAIAQWNSYEKSRYYSGSSIGTFQAGSYGHVAWVAGVYSDGSVLVRQYNVFGNRSYSQMHLRAPRYIYIY